MTSSNQSREDGAGTDELSLENIATEIDKIRPMLQRDGGDIQLLGLEDGVVRVRLTGACAGCAFAALTLQHGVEKVLRRRFPELVRVENDASAG
ncbi:NifU family protein [Candidatus Fermentibacterales bacterium]|nr:NifU family protein [Candidatus Fermentibacterales bacterium]